MESPTHTSNKEIRYKPKLIELRGTFDLPDWGTDEEHLIRHSCLKLGNAKYNFSMKFIKQSKPNENEAEKQDVTIGLQLSTTTLESFDVILKGERLEAVDGVEEDRKIFLFSKEFVINKTEPEFGPPIIENVLKIKEWQRDEITGHCKLVNLFPKNLKLRFTAVIGGLSYDETAPTHRFPTE